MQAGLMAGVGMSAKQAAALCTLETFGQIFPAPSKLAAGLLSLKYDGKGKRAQCKRFYDDTKLKDARIPLVIPIFDITTNEAQCINDLDHGQKTLYEVVDASSAAPTFFPPVTIKSHDGTSHKYVDGGLFANDPSLCAYLDAKDRWPDADIRLLSVGTGAAVNNYPDSCATWGGKDWLMQGDLIGLCLSTSITQKQVQSILGVNYVRINGDLVAAGCSPEMDDISAKNIAALKNLGRVLFQHSGYHVVNLIIRDMIPEFDRANRRIGEPQDHQHCAKIAILENGVLIG